MSIIIIAGCDSGNKIDQTESLRLLGESRQAEEFAEAKNADKNVIEAFNTTKKFIGWYNKNVDKLDQDKLVMYSDSCDYYIMNEEHAAFYVKQFERTGLVSEKFLEGLRLDFKSFREYFEEERLDKDTDGPIGYPFDLIYYGQDPDYLVNINEIELMEFTVNEDNIVLYLDVLGYVSLVEDKRNRWLIEKIH